MHVLVTGSSGHLGAALAHVLGARGDTVVGLDVVAAPTTTVIGSVADPAVVRRAADGADVVLHTATLHKPHVDTHPPRAFVETNVTGTLTVLEAARDAGVASVVMTSTTSAFGQALQPAPGAPAAWVTEDVHGTPKNIYGATKVAAEDLCALAHHQHGLPTIVLRVSRFFPEADDDPARRALEDDNLKAVEYLHRRVAIEDVVDAHVRAAAVGPLLGHDRLIISATTPFEASDRDDLTHRPGDALRRRAPDVAELMGQLGWRLPPHIGRVYDNRRARAVLGWEPGWDARRICAQARDTGSVITPLQRVVGARGYHPGGLVDGMYRTS